MLHLIEHYHKLDSIIRCNCLPRLRDNTVKAHSAGVALAALVIAKYEQKFLKKEINVEELLVRALVHDLEEIYSGDVPYPFKAVPGVREKLKEAVCPSMKKLLDRHPHIYAHWANGKKFGIEGKILAYADMLDLCMYCIQEVELGNTHMIPVIDKALSVARDLKLNFDESEDMKEFRRRVNIMKISAHEISIIERGIK